MEKGIDSCVGVMCSSNNCGKKCVLGETGDFGVVWGRLGGGGLMGAAGVGDASPSPLRHVGGSS